MIPGVSSRIIWKSSPDRMPRMRWRVVCAFLVTADSFCPSRLFSSVLLPAFGLPINVTYPTVHVPAQCDAVNDAHKFLVKVLNSEKVHPLTFACNIDAEGLMVHLYAHQQHNYEIRKDVDKKWLHIWLKGSVWMATIESLPSPSVTTWSE